MVSILQRAALAAILVLLLVSAASAAGKTGWWWDPAENGWGVSFEEQGDKAYLCWYLYGDDGQDVWYSALMDRTSGDEFSGQLIEYRGWPLEAGYDGSDPDPAITVGTVIVNFSDDDNGAMTVTGVARATVNKTLSRVFPSGTADPRDLDGWWWDPNQNGIGWFVEAVNDTLFLAWYNYRAAAARGDATPRWYISINAFRPSDTHFASNLLSYKDGQTITGAYPGTPDETVEGLLEFDVPAAGPVNNLTINYGGHTYNLVPFPFGGGQGGGDCNPEVTNWTPLGNNAFLPATITATFNSPCGTAIDKSTITMSLNGDAVTPTLSGDGATVTATYVYDVEVDTDTHVVVSAKDADGNSVTHDWTFYTPFIY